MISQQSLFPQAWTWRGRVGTSSARFSEDRKYRYELRRTWDPARRPLVVVACNPSTADEGHRDDPTCRRLYSFADRWGCGGVLLLNVFALCSTDPKALRAAVKAGRDPIGAENDAVIRSTLERHASDRLLLAWGINGALNGRGSAVAKLALDIHGAPECFGLTDNDQPHHPLYLPDVSVPHPYSQLIAERARTR